jgi:hypothetical protein
MKWMTLSAALLVCCVANSADAGLFGCCKKKNNCCQQSHSCCEPAPAPCCEPAPMSCCEPAHSCCQPKKKCFLSGLFGCCKKKHHHHDCCGGYAAPAPACGCGY